jgi:hypothetical protein
VCVCVCVCVCVVGEISDGAAIRYGYELWVRMVSESNMQSKTPSRVTHTHDSRHLERIPGMKRIIVMSQCLQILRSSAQFYGTYVMKNTK